MRHLVLAVVAVLAVGSLLVFGEAQACGTERWAVKTLTDSAAKQVDFAHVHAATVAELVNLTPPPGEPVERTEAEKSVVRVLVTLIAYKAEPDDDIHLVVGNPAHPGTTMIVEFPALFCTQGAQHRYAMKLARERFVRDFGVPSPDHYTAASGIATLTGVLFFDRIHGQRGVAPNGIEVHPVLRFRLSRGAA
jgi:hypothetical protein